MHAGTPGTLAPGPFQQFNCVINTVVSLLGAALAAFVASSAVHGKLDMVSMLTAALLHFDASHLHMSLVEIHTMPGGVVVL